MSAPLDGIVVLDLTQIYNGPYATFLMAMAGAEVIKIEPPGGESLRRRGVVGGAALPFAMLNGGKASVCLDLKLKEGREALLELATKADVLVENFAPGAMDRLGLSDAILSAHNPRLILASSSGFGSDGPYRNFPAMDLTVQAFAGVMECTGFPENPPVKAGPALCDFFAGVHLYGAIVTALLDRERSGKVRRVEVAMQDAVYPSLASSLGLDWKIDGGVKVPPRTGNRHGGLAESPYNVYETRDGHIAIICTTERHWRSLAETMGEPDLADDPQFDSLGKRVENSDVIDAIITSWTRERTKAEVFDTLCAAHVPSAPVRTLADVAADENMHARGALQWLEHPELGRIVLPQSPLRFDGGSVRPLEPSRRLGSDTYEILRQHTWLDEDSIRRLAKASGCESEGCDG